MLLNTKAYDEDGDCKPDDDDRSNGETGIHRLRQGCYRKSDSEDGKAGECRGHFKQRNLGDAHKKNG